MAEELKRVRINFVSKASKELLNQLLDELLCDGILNDGEKEAIIEENYTRANRARNIIDLLRKKGDKASWKFIAHLEKRDPTLHKELKLSAPPPPPPSSQDSALMLDQDTPDGPMKTTEAFWRKKQSDVHVYRVTRDNVKNRVALLITNIHFRDAKKNRNGAEEDEEVMERLLSNLGYEVVKYRDLTAQAIDEALTRFSSHTKLRRTDSVVVVIMSHGKERNICGVEFDPDVGDKDLFPIDDIYKALGPKKCAALLNKPKIIIIQACREDNDGSAHVYKDAATGEESTEDVVEDRVLVVHKEKDIISLLYCTSETFSHRQRFYGSYLIQFLEEEFYRYAHEDDVEVLFRKVMRRFEDLPIAIDQRQMPIKERCTLTKAFYFFPGL